MGVKKGRVIRSPRRGRVALDLSRPLPLCPPFPFNPQPGVRITPDVQPRLSWAVGLYSDLHKDVYGVRPRGFLPEPLPEGSDLEELVAEIEGEIEWLTGHEDRLTVE